jgi:hypothetical protein
MTGVLSRLVTMQHFSDLGLPLVWIVFSDGCHCHTPFMRVGFGVLRRSTDYIHVVERV